MNAITKITIEGNTSTAWAGIYPVKIGTVADMVDAFNSAPSDSLEFVIAFGCYAGAPEAVKSKREKTCIKRAEKIAGLVGKRLGEFTPYTIEGFEQYAKKVAVAK